MRLGLLGVAGLEKMAALSCADVPVPLFRARKRAAVELSTTPGQKGPCLRVKVASVPLLMSPRRHRR